MGNPRPTWRTLVGLSRTPGETFGCGLVTSASASHHLWDALWKSSDPLINCCCVVVVVVVVVVVMSG